MSSCMNHCQLKSGIGIDISHVLNGIYKEVSVICSTRKKIANQSLGLIYTEQENYCDVKGVGNLDLCLHGILEGNILT